MTPHQDDIKPRIHSEQLEKMEKPSLGSCIPGESVFNIPLHPDGREMPLELFNEIEISYFPYHKKCMPGEKVPSRYDEFGGIKIDGSVGYPEAGIFQISKEGGVNK